MKTKKTLTITRDYDLNDSYNLFREDINYLVNELNVFCEIHNNNFENIIEDEKRYNSYKDDYKDSKTIISKGYVQSEFQVYNIYYNEFEIENLTSIKKEYLNQLFQLLENSFTHFNQNYYFEIRESITLKGIQYDSKPLEDGYFCVYNSEFPTKDEIYKEFDREYFNEFDYDEVIIKKDYK